MLLHSPAICYWASVLDPRKLIGKRPLEEELRNWSSSDLKTSTRPYVCGMAVWALHRLGQLAHRVLVRSLAAVQRQLEAFCVMTTFAL